jgi:hypothetical protein
MDGFGEPLFDQTPRCFDHFAIIMLNKSNYSAGHLWYQRSA